MTIETFHCQICDKGALHLIEGFAALPRVTSDSKPFGAGGTLSVCEACGGIQKIPDATWLREISEIYRDYAMYHQSSSNDQTVFDLLSGHPSGRSEVLSRRLKQLGLLADSGKLLDVGAGNGAMLEAFSSVFNGWKLFGLDLDNRKENTLKAIPRFQRLYTVPPAEIPDQFDLVTLVHSLEHFPGPHQMLCALHGKMVENGRIFVQVNNIDKTPFDLLVADHLCHFTPASLACLMSRARFAIDNLATDWINKEISLLAKVTARLDEAAGDNPQIAITRTTRNVNWLQGLLNHAHDIASASHFGIFGTSIAATWLADGLGEKVRFFVDEDPAREGRAHLGRPILKPAQVPPGAVVYLAFVREVSGAISRRLADLPVTFVAPPETAA